MFSRLAVLGVGNAGEGFLTGSVYGVVLPLRGGGILQIGGEKVCFKLGFGGVVARVIGEW
jgi:hypothetical protein